MNYKFLLVSFLCTITLFSQAKTLSPQEALNRIGNTGNSPLKAIKYSPRLAHTIQSSTGTPSVYLFDTNENGFMIVSADDRAEALLGFGDTPITHGESIPENLQWWLNQYALQIESAPENGDSSDNTSTQYPVGEIAPMVSTYWDQSTPYNNQCPLVNGRITMTGCLATAMAQVMKYHEYPAEGTGSITYQNATGTYSMEFGKLDWENMLDKYIAGNYTTTQADAVAYLMKSCGYSLQMYYAPTESVASSADCYNALVNYFSYDPNIHIVMRDYYPLAQWDNMLYENLKNVGPVIYTGTDSSIGHAFVCDGYSSDGYFHINWGWSGAYNGYFRTTALKPSGVGIGGGSGEGYNFGQAMVLGIQPPNENAQTPQPEILQSGDLDISYSYANYSRNLTLSVANYGMFTHYVNPQLEFRFGVILEYPDGKYEDFYDEYFQLSSWRKIPSGYGVPDYIVTLPSYLMHGTYKVYPAYKLKGEEGYHRILAPLGAIDHGLLTVTVDGYSVRPAEKQALTGEITEVKTDFYVGENFLVNAKVSNYNTTEIISSIYLGFTHPSTGTLVARSDQKAVSLLPGEESIIEIFSGFQEATALTAGTYNMVLYDANTETALDSRECTIQASPGTPIIECTSLTFKEDKVNPLNLVFEADIKCTSGYFSQGLELIIYPYDEYYLPQTTLALFNSNPLFISAGESCRLEINGNFIQGETDKSYTARLAWYSEKTYKYYDLTKTTFTIPQVSGIEEIEIETSLNTPEYFNLQGIKVYNPEPGQIYLRRIGTKIEKVIYK